MSKAALKVTAFVVIAAFGVGCSTTYRVAQSDLDRLGAGEAVANIKAEDGADIDFTHYSFVYRAESTDAPLRIKGIESLNASAEAKQLQGLRWLRAEPGIGDKAWQRSVLGGGVGLAAGLGVGFAITNRVISEQAAANGGSCATCGTGYLLLGTAISGVLGAAAGALIAYFGGAGVGSTRDATVEFIGGAGASASTQAATPAEPTSAPAQ